MLLRKRRRRRRPARPRRRGGAPLRRAPVCFVCSWGFSSCFAVVSVWMTRAWHRGTGAPREEIASGRGSERYGLKGFLAHTKLSWTPRWSVQGQGASSASSQHARAEQEEGARGGARSAQTHQLDLGRGLRRERPSPGAQVLPERRGVLLLCCSCVCCCARAATTIGGRRDPRLGARGRRRQDPGGHARAGRGGRAGGRRSHGTPKQHCCCFFLLTRGAASKSGGGEGVGCLGHKTEGCTGDGDGVVYTDGVASFCEEVDLSERATLAPLGLSPPFSTHLLLARNARPRPRKDLSSCASAPGMWPSTGPTSSCGPGHRSSDCLQRFGVRARAASEAPSASLLLRHLTRRRPPAAAAAAAAAAAPPPPAPPPPPLAAAQQQQQPELRALPPPLPPPQPQPQP
jgi:hypothetical protein